MGTTRYLSYINQRIFMLESKNFQTYGDSNQQTEQVEILPKTTNLNYYIQYLLKNPTKIFMK